MLQTALAVAATLIAVAFGLSTYERWLARRRRHELTWTVALAIFALASAALATGSALGWSAGTFRLFYLFGAILNVPVLALGTVYLLAGASAGDRWALVVALGAAFATGVMAVAPFTASLPRHELAQGSQVLGPLPRVLAGVASGGGALVVVGGAVWSALRVRRGTLVVANSLIAGGTIVTGASGLLNSVLGDMTAFAVTLVAGISLIFVGFLVATTPAPVPSVREGAKVPSPSAGVASDAASDAPDHTAAGRSADQEPSHRASPESGAAPSPPPRAAARPRT